MTNFVNPFILDAKEYVRDLNLLSHYVNDTAKYLSVMKNIPIEQCTTYIKNNLSKQGKYPFKDKRIKYLQRLENGDRSEQQGGLLEYINDSINNKQLIAPTLTTYINTKDKPSLLSKYIEGNIKGRNKAKKEMFIAKASGNSLLEATKKIEQTNRKLANNAISGAHVSPSTPLYNKTAHSTLTSNCRSTSGYGNANNEKFLSGNRHYFNHHIVINNVISIINNTDYEKLLLVINKYNLHYPTSEQVCEAIKYSTDLYWFEASYFNKITSLVNKLTPIQRLAFLYTGDIYHLKKYNDSLVRTFISRLSSKISNGECNNNEVLKNTPEDHLNLAHQLCVNETKGIGKDHSKMNDTDQNTLALTCLNISNVLTEYSDLIKVLWVTKNFPASVAHFPTSIRRSALTSDTDSTIFTVQDWVVWARGKISFDLQATSIAATMIFLASSTITHLLAMMSANFGIDKSNLFKIAMKNEFKFDVFVPTQLGKHYYANISCQEGNVYNEHEIEIKGVHLKSSSAPKSITKQAANMMQDIMKDVMSGNGVSVDKYLTLVADIERSIVSSIHKGEYIYFRLSSIKNPMSYKKDKENSPYTRHTFWNEVFGEKYGIMEEPPYSVVLINVNVDNVTKFKNWVESIKDNNIKTRLKNWLDRNNKNIIPTFYIPTQVMSSKGLPVELIDIIDYRKIIIGCCNVFYIILETLGIYINGDRANRIVSDDY